MLSNDDVNGGVNLRDSGGTGRGTVDEGLAVAVVVRPSRCLPLLQPPAVFDAFAASGLLLERHAFCRPPLAGKRTMP